MNKLKFRIIFVIISSIFILFNSCKSNNNEELSLKNKGVPVTITVPKDCKITEGVGNTEFDGIKYLNYVVKKDKFILDVFMPVDSPQGDVSDYVKRAKEQANEQEDFVEFVKMEDSGFIYKIKTDEGFDYNFNYTIIKENRAIEFVAGLNFSDYTLGEVEKIYEAAKTAK